MQVQPGGLLVEAHQLEPRRAVLQQVDALLVVLDRRLALALVREPGADLAVQVGHALEVLLSAVPVEALRPDSDGLVHAPEPQRDVAQLLRHAHPRAPPSRPRAHGGSARRPRGSSTGARRRRRPPSRKRTALAHVRELALGDAALTAECGRAPVVLGEQRHHLVRRPPCALLEERADLEVLARAHRLGQHPVRHVADQHVLERQLALGVGLEDVLLLERHERVSEVAPLRLGERRQRLLPEGPGPTTEACCTSRRSNGSSESSRAASTACTVSGSSAACAAALLGDAAGHLLGEERVAAGALGHGGHDVPAFGQERRDQLAGMLLGSGLEQQLTWPRGVRRPSRAAGRAARRGRGRRSSAARAPTGRGARWRRACRRRPSGCPRTRARAAGAWRHRLDPARSAEKKASRMRSGSGSAGASSAGTSSPSRRPIRAALHPRRRWPRRRRRTARSVRSQSLSQASSAESRVDDAALGAEHLPERPVDDPGAVGQAATVRTLGAESCSPRRRSNSRSRRDLPTPASPTIVTSCGEPSRTTRS